MNGSRRIFIRTKKEREIKKKQQPSQIIINFSKYILFMLLKFFLFLHLSLCQIKISTKEKRVLNKLFY